MDYKKINNILKIIGNKTDKKIFTFQKHYLSNTGTVNKRTVLKQY